MQKTVAERYGSVMTVCQFFYDNDIEFNEDWFLLIPKEFSKHIMINKREVVRLDFVLRRLIGRRENDQ